VGEYSPESVSIPIVELEGAKAVHQEVIDAAARI
jgi:hypothetical protein